MSDIKMIWDFRGADAEGLARHHTKHLEEYAARENYGEGSTGCSAVQDKHWIAWLMVSEENMIAVRDALRPHRAQRIG